LLRIGRNNLKYLKIWEDIHQTHFKVKQLASLLNINEHKDQKKGEYRKIWAKIDRTVKTVINSIWGLVIWLRVIVSLWSGLIKWYQGRTS